MKPSNETHTVPVSMFFVVRDLTQGDGTRLIGIPLTKPCQSLRGARNALKRVRKRTPDAYVQERRRTSP